MSPKIIELIDSSKNLALNPLVFIASCYVISLTIMTVLDYIERKPTPGEKWQAIARIGLILGTAMMLFGIPLVLIKKLAIARTLMIYGTIFIAAGMFIKELFKIQKSKTKNKTTR